MTRDSDDNSIEHDIGIDVLIGRSGYGVGGSVACCQLTISQDNSAQQAELTKPQASCGGVKMQIVGHETRQI